MTSTDIKKPLNVVIACGGTGGHLFPGIAVAQELKKRGHHVILQMSQKKIDSQSTQNYGDLEFKTVEAIAMPKIPSLAMFGFFKKLFKAQRSCKALFQEMKTDVVLGMGGFTSFPAIRAAHKMGIKTFVHDSNALPGKANRLTSRWCDKVLLGVEEAKHYISNKNRCVITGTPVRLEMLEKPDPSEAKQYFHLPQNRPTVLVMGGSQGAKNLNSLVVEAASQCQELCDFLIITGASDYERVKQLAEGMNHVHVLEFCSTMSLAYAAADVVISRSGASSLTELAHVGKGALLIPYPYAADDHQAHNARVFAAHGAAKMIRESSLTPDDIVTFLCEVLHDKNILQTMNSSARQMDVPDAASQIADIIEQSQGNA